MSDPKIKLKRSSVEGKIPTPDQVPLGELALNTYDGQLYASKNVGVGTTVIAINPFKVGTGTDSYDAYFTQGNVGIGTEVPDGPAHSSNSSVLNVGVVTANYLYGDGSNISNISGTVVSGVVTNIQAGNGITILESPSGNFIITSTAVGSSATRTVTSQTATAGQTTFSVSYTVNNIDVYLNGAKLESSEFTATNGTSVVLATGATANDVLEFVVYTFVGIAVTATGSNGQLQYYDNGSFSSAEVYYTNGNLGIGTATPLNPVSVGNTAILNVGVVTANYLYGDGSNLTGIQAGYWEKTDAGINTSTNIGIGTTNPTSALTVSGDADVTGVITATSFSGDGSNLTGLATALSEFTNDVGFVTFTNVSQLTNDAGFITNVVSGVLTATSFVGDGSNLTGLQAGYWEKTSAGINTSTNIGIGTTNPTSALTVSGDADVTGVVTATSFVGDVTGDATGLSGSPSITVTDITASGNVSIAGTLTYEDVTNVDSVGLITARSGIIATGVVTATSFSGDGSNLTGLATALSEFTNDVGFVTFTNNNQLTNGAGYITNVVSGVVTATSFSGDGSNLTGLATALSEFTNDVGFVTFTNVSQLNNDSGYITTSFTSTSQLTNDAGFITNVVSGVLTATSFSGDGSNLTGIQAGYWEKTDVGINTSTNIGIGTTNPTSALTVSGDANITGVITATSFVGSAANLTSLTGASSGTYGTTGAVPVITVDANGRITGITTTTSTDTSSVTERSTTTTTATAGQTTFSVTYSVGYVDVYLNGVRLASSDFTATNGTSVVLGTAASLDDVLEFVSYSNVGLSTVSPDIVGDTTPQLGGNLDLNSNDITGTGNVNVTGITTISTGIGTVHIGAGSTTLVVQGDARVTGILTVGQGSITIDPIARKITGIDEIVVGNATTNRTSIKQNAQGRIAFERDDGTEASVGIGSTVSVNTTGIITATSFVGDGSNLTGLATALSEFTNDAGYITTSFTSTSQLTNDAGFITNVVSGILTATDLNVTGNVSIAGTLTYEDVTNVDSVGLITARSGIIATGVVTATSFSGDGSNLTGLQSGYWEKTDVGIHTLSNIGIGTTNPTNAALHIEGRNLSLGGPGYNSSGESNLYLGDYDAPANNTYDPNIRVGTRGEFQFEIESDYGNGTRSNNTFYASPDGLGLNIYGDSSSPGPIFYYNYSRTAADQYFYLSANSKYLWFDGDTGRLGVNRGTGNGWTDTLDVNGTARVTGIAKFDSSILIGGHTTGPSNQTPKIEAREDGTSDVWRALINSSNDTADKSAFLGIFGSKPGVFAHDRDMTAWDTLYLNTVDPLTTTSGGDVYTGGKFAIGTNNPSGYTFVCEKRDSSGTTGTKNLVAKFVNAGQNTLELNMYGGATDQVQFAATNQEQTISFLTGVNTANVDSTEVTLLMTQGRDLWAQGPNASNYGGSLFIGREASPYGNLCALRDSNNRPLIYLGGKYPEITLAHTVASNQSHGPTIRFATYVQSTNTATGNQFVIGTNGAGTFLDIGHATAAQGANVHNGINSYNGTHRFRVTTSGCEVNGNLKFPNGNGIDFASTSDASGMTSEVLDDYEEGTWTPTVSGTGFSSFTAGSANLGRYTKVGRMVTASATIHWTSASYNGLAIIGGLPFASNSATNFRAAGLIPGQSSGFYTDPLTSFNSLKVGIDWGLSYAYVVQADESISSGANYNHYPKLNSAGYIYGFTITYQAD